VIIGAIVLGLIILGIVVTNLVNRYNPHAVLSVTRRRVGISAGADALSIATLKKLGITRVRTSLLWSLYLDTRTWSPIDRVTPDPAGLTNAQFFALDMTTLRTAGLSVLVVVHTPPVGMSLATGITSMPTFVATLAAAFPGTAWEIMNEPNTDDSFNGGWFSASDGSVTDTTRGDRYGQLIGPVYDAIKAADATATVVTGGTGGPQAGFYTGLAARAPGKFDAFAIHAYGAPDAKVNFVILSELMRTAAPGVSLWCTECGNSQTLDTQAAQAAQSADLGACLDENDRNNRYEAVYFYTLMPDGLGYNIVRSDGSLRQAALLFMNRTAA
jgi:hypothetical protein